MSSANSDQQIFWSGEMGQQWADLEASLDRVHGAFNVPLMEAAGLRPGKRVLDLGCGTGHLSRAAAARVAPGGSVTGIDISPVMLANARKGVSGEGAAPLNFIEGDAQAYGFKPRAYDRVISRLGAMFFSDPAAALSNLREAVPIGGQFHAITWRDGAQDNPWFYEPRRIAAEVLRVEVEPVTTAPGPLAWSDSDYALSLLEYGGWDRAEADRVEVILRVPGGEPGALSLLTQIGPGSGLIRRMQAAPIDVATYRNHLSRWLREIMTGPNLEIKVVMNLFRATRMH
ncbi:MAG: class I SAM-dependent methyltransferase [Pseudomonadota bacterium]